MYVFILSRRFSFKSNFILEWNSTHFILGWNSRVNRNFFILGWVSSRDEISSQLHVNALLIVLFDYFWKCSEAKQKLLKKSVPTVASFLYEIICWHECIKIQINDKGKEVVYQVAERLYKTTGTEQQITSEYHPHSNGFCEPQNCAIKDSLIKILEEFSLIQKNICKWNI